MASSELTKQLGAILNSANPTLDSEDPAINALFIQFGANLISNVDQRVLAIRNRLAPGSLTTLSDLELAEYAYARGLTRYAGSYSRGYAFIIVSQVPSTGVSLKAGDVVATEDGQWQYMLTSALTVSSANLALYYNSAISAYEFRVPVQAVRAGSDYDLPVGRLKVIKSVYPFAARVENREKITGGKDAETREEFISRIERVNAGFNLNTTEGVLQAVRSAVPEVEDLQLDPNTQNPSELKLYYIGLDPMANAISHTLVSATDRFINLPTEHQPIRYVDLVMLEDSPLDASSYSFSTSQVILNPNVTRQPGEIVYISYQYNGLTATLRQRIDAKINLRKMTWTIQEATPVAVKLTCRLKLGSYLNLMESSSLMLNEILNLIPGNSFVDSLNGAVLASSLKTAIPSIIDAEILINGLPSLSFNYGLYPTLAADDVEFLEY